MKRKRIRVIIALLALAYTSCKNDLNILAPYKDVTVVYGLLDQNDPIHYFRINKGFEGSGNAYVMAQQYDSIYYPVSSIHAYLEDSSTTTYSIIDTINLDTTTTVPLGPGVFSYPKQLLYYTARVLNPNDYYNLIIKNTKTGKTVRGSTGLLSDIQFSNGLNLNPNLTISFDNMYPTTIGWTTTPNARIYQMDIRFYYKEWYENMGDTSYKYLDWVFVPVTSPTISGNVLLSYSLTAEGLYTLIASSMKPTLDLLRYNDSISIIFTSGSDDLNTYVQLSQPSLGINQDVPLYTDLENSIGLYTARHVQNIHKQLSKQNIDTLVRGPITGNLGFVYVIP